MAAIQLNLPTPYTLKHHYNYKQPSKINKLILPNSTSQRPLKFKVKARAAGPTNGRQLIQSGAVRAILAKDATNAMNTEGFIMLDVRPSWEREKASVAGSVHVPLFVRDPDNGPLTLLKKWVHLGYIGLWTGQEFTMLNLDFVLQVEAAVPDKDTKLLVACGEGLRSMMAVSKLHEGGYKNIGWLAGGFNRSEEGDFSVEGPEKLQYATIGGASYYFLQLLLLLQALGKPQE